METIIQLCQRCGNRLQPQRARIRKRRSSLQGVCDICRRNAAVSSASSFGLSALTAPQRPSVPGQGARPS